MCHGFNALEMHVIIVTCGGKKIFDFKSVFVFLYLSYMLDTNCST